MLIKGLLASEMSGKLGGIVAAHNPGGQYFRIFRIPTNPATAAQTAVRNAFLTAGAQWNSDLTEQQRDDWNAYATALGSTNALGDAIDPGGKGLYQGFATPRLRNSLPMPNPAPTVIERAGFTTPTVVSFDLGAQTVSIGYDNSDGWAIEDDGALLVYISPPRSLSINFFKGPYRLAGLELGNTATPPTSPVVIPLPFTIAAGQRVFFRFRATRADGRLAVAQSFLSDA